MSEDGKITVNFKGIAAETGRVAWSGADGVTVSAQGQYLVLAVHHAGQSHYVWLCPDAWEALGAVLTPALRKCTKAAEKLARHDGETVQ